MTSILQIMMALPSIITTISELIKLAEEAIGSEKGAEKKEAVMASIQAMVNNSELWAKVKILFSGIINMVALFTVGASGKDPVSK